MTSKMQEQAGERLYRELVNETKDLVRRMSTHRKLTYFDNFIEDLSHLRERVILEGYENMPHEKYAQLTCLMDNTKQYLHEILDVLQVRDMQNSLDDKL